MLILLLLFEMVAFSADLLITNNLIEQQNAP